jgi:uncharacterized membrane protein
MWAIPTAIAAFLLHGARLVWYQRRLRQTAQSRASGISNAQA